MSKYFDGELLSAYEDLNKEFECKKENVKLHEKIADLEAKLAESQNCACKHIGELTKIATEKDRKIEELKQQLAELDSELAENVRENECLKEQLAESEKKYDKLFECYKNTSSKDLDDKYRLADEIEQLKQQLHQIYSHLGVEAFCEDIHEYALKEIGRLQEQLAESESKIKVGAFWHSAYQGKQLDYDKLNNDYNKQEKLLSEVLANKSELQFEFDQLKQQLAEKDVDLSLARNEIDTLKHNLKVAQEHDNVMCEQYFEKCKKINQDKISFALEQLEKVKSLIENVPDEADLYDEYVFQEGMRDSCIKIIDSQIEELTHQHEDKGE